MKLIPVSTLLASVIFSVLAAIPFLRSTQSAPDDFYVEAVMSASVSTTAQLYYDAGPGFDEAASVRQRVPSPGSPRPVIFPLPPGTYRGFRFDPSDGPGAVALHGPIRILSPKGRIVHGIPLSAVKAQQEIARAVVDGDVLRLEIASAAIDPQLLIPLPAPVEVGYTFAERVDGLAGRAGLVLAVLLLASLLVRRSSVSGAISARVVPLLEKPVLALAMATAFAVILSAYPVVFLGRSYVSPNWGTALLYHAYPTLPGYGSTYAPPDIGSDMGATIYQHLPYATVQRYALEQGEVPWWNRFNGGGSPLIAQGQSMFGDPLNFLILLSPRSAWLWDVKFLLCKWLLALGVGLVVLTVQRQSHPPVGPAPDADRRSSVIAMVVAGSMPFIGFYVYRINHPAIFTLTYAPWVLYGWLRLREAAGIKPHLAALGVLLSANVFLFNSGTVKEAVMLILQMNLAGALAVLAADVPWKIRLSRCLAAAWAGVLAFLLCAPVWLSFLTTLSHALTSYQTPVAHQIQPSLALGFFDELFFRPLSPRELVFNPALNFLLLFGLLYFFATIRSHASNRLAMALLGVCAAGALVVFGAISPRLITAVPFLGNVDHIENCVICGLIVLVPALSALGFRSAAERLGTREGLGDVFICGGLLLVLVGAWMGYWHAAHRGVFGPDSVRSLVASGQVLPVSGFVWASLAAGVAAFIGLAAVARHVAVARRCSFAATLMTISCVSVLFWRHGFHDRGMGFDRYVVQPPVRARLDVPSGAVEFLQRAQRATPSRAVGMLNHFFPGWVTTYRLESVCGPDALQNPYLRDVLDASGLTWSGWRLLLFPRDVPQARPVLDALNVRYYVDGPDSRALYGDSGLTRAVSADLDCHESPTAWPRAFFTDRVAPYGLAGDLVALVRQQGKPFAAFQVSDADAAAAFGGLPSDLAAATVTPAAHYRLTANRTSFEVTSSGPGVVVLLETFWPGDFAAVVDGRAAPVLRLNHAFKGVKIDHAGTHRVEFVYMGDKYTLRGTLFAAGVVLAIGTFVVPAAAVRRRGRGP